MSRGGIHESGYLHVGGESIYVDDISPPRGLLHGHIVPSPVAHGRIVRLDVSGALAVPGVKAALTYRDIPGVNDIAPIAHDEPLLAEEDVHCVGQAVALIVADSPRACRRAAEAVQLEIEPRLPCLSLDEAIAANRFFGDVQVIQRGDVEQALRGAELQLEGELRTGGQEHFYLETQVALVIPEESGNVTIHSSTQHPTGVQAKVAKILGITRHRVEVKCPRMGGAFGGKETQAAHVAAWAALGSYKTGRPVKIRLTRSQDMTQTGKRHPALVRYRAGFDADGRILALAVQVYLDGGWSLDLSEPVLTRCLLQIDNAYYIPHIHISGRVARTNMLSNTAFRGFGGTQGILSIECIMNQGAEHLGLDPAVVRRRNYYGDAPRNQTPFGQELTDCRLERIHEELMASSEYDARRQAIDAFNSQSTWIKRGIGFSPVKFGISFVQHIFNQAGALLVVYTDGTIQLNHGGTEMGQGLHTKMRLIVARELGVPMEHIRVMATSTATVPNASATSASSGSDLNGQAVRNACIKLRERLRPVAAALLQLEEKEVERLRFQEGKVFVDGSGSEPRAVTFAKLVRHAHASQVSLEATGYYRVNDTWYDPSIGKGNAIRYYAYGAAVTEVQVNGLTGEFVLSRVDILHDVGDPLAEAIDLGQIEGGFIQGLGWLTCEELGWDGEGRLITCGPDSYKIPTMGQVPRDFRVRLLEKAPQDGTIYGSKGVGEPPLVLSISVVVALRHAIGAYATKKGEVDLRLPCTPEAVLRAIDAGA